MYIDSGLFFRLVLPDFRIFIQNIHYISVTIFFAFFNCRNLRFTNALHVTVLTSEKVYSGLFKFFFLIWTQRASSKVEVTASYDMAKEPCFPAKIFYRPNIQKSNLKINFFIVLNVRVLKGFIHLNDLGQSIFSSSYNHVFIL